MKKITLVGGADRITIALPNAVYYALKSGKVSLTDKHVLTTAQKKKLSAFGNFDNVTILF